MNTPATDRAPTSGSPVRTCVGCRGKAPQGDLLRVVLVNGRLVPDPRRELPGRGAYVHPSQECVATALARKAFGRALRTGGALDSTDLVRTLQPLTESNVGSVGMTTR
ncbi:MAG TPA: YlxR family protein [Actinomycetota bacterium]|nr:YlxR family protein [Actinomycetota bacterium]